MIVPTPETIKKRKLPRKLTKKQLEDRADYASAVESLKDPAPSIPLEEVMKRYGMEYRIKTKSQ